MIWQTHRRIATDVMKRLDLHLTSAEHSKLMEGVIDPDKWKDYPHHYGKNEEIRKNLLNARSFFLRNDSLNAYYCLGVALHYIQDSYTTCPSYLDRHHKWEEGIEKCYYSADLSEVIQRDIERREVRNRYLRLAKELSTDVQGRDDTLRVATLNGQTKTDDGMTSPRVDLNLGYAASYLVSKAVLGPKYNPHLDIGLSKLLQDFEGRLVTADIESTNNIIGLLRKRDELNARMVPTGGLTGKIRNWLTGRKLRAIERRVVTEHDDYTNRRHLGKVAARYNAEAERMISSYGGWYNYEVASLGIGNVPLELIGFHDIAATYHMDQRALRGILDERNVPVYRLGDNEMVRRADRVEARIGPQGLGAGMITSER